MENYEQLISSHSPNEPMETVSENDIAAIYYSSGTTGRPKGAVHTNKSMVAEMLLPIELPALGLAPDDIALCIMPFFHVGGSANHMLAVYAAGGTSVILKIFDEEAVLKAIEKFRITYICMVPAMIIRLMDYLEQNKFDLTSLITIAYTGAPMPLESMKRAVKKLLDS